jgi:hypothetical protein
MYRRHSSSSPSFVILASRFLILAAPFVILAKGGDPRTAIRFNTVSLQE